MASTNIAELQSSRIERPSSEMTLFRMLDNPRFAKAIGAVAAKFFTPDRFLRLSINAIKKTPLLAQCDPETVLGAFMTSAALGLEPNTVQQQAFLIPYKKRANVAGKWTDVYECQFQVGYRGFITLAHRSPHISSIQAQAIHERDLFDHMMGSESFLRFRVNLQDRGELIGAFCHTKLESGIELATVLPLNEIHKIRSKSETYNALLRNIDSAENSKERDKAQKKFDETPWVMWEDDMAAKSAIKKHAKQLPLSEGDAMSAATVIDDKGEGQTIDLKAMADVDVARSVVADGEEPPALEHMEAVTVGMEIPSQREREAIHVDRQERAPQSNAAQRQERQPATSRTADDLPPDDGGPTIDDALANVERGDFDMARDIAHSLGADAINAVERAIVVKEGQATQGKQAPQGTRGRGAFGNVE